MAGLYTALTRNPSYRLADRGFHSLTFAAAGCVFLCLLGVALCLFLGAWPALHTFGLGFFLSEAWNPPQDHFGAAAALYGTGVTAILAMSLAVPLGLAIAIFLTYLCPPFLRGPVGIAIELLAGIPSIIYGIWGAYFLCPFMQKTLQPFLIATFGSIWGIGALFQGPPFGYGILTAGLVLAVMILPFIAAITRDALAMVPPALQEAAYGLGCTTFEGIWYIFMPSIRASFIGSIMLALGRALGETMAVTFVIGNDPHIHASLLAQGVTISSQIANAFADADTPLFEASLLALGLTLFVITMIFLLLAQLMLAQGRPR